jgi:hypothetical protein
MSTRLDSSLPPDPTWRRRLPSKRKIARRGGATSTCRACSPALNSAAPAHTPSTPPRLLTHKGMKEGQESEVGRNVPPAPPSSSSHRRRGKPSAPAVRSRTQGHGSDPVLFFSQIDPVLQLRVQRSSPGRPQLWGVAPDRVEARALMGKKFRRGWGKLFAALELQKFCACGHATTEKRRGCRMDLPGPTTSVGTRTDYSVGPWDYLTCVARYLMA